MTKDVRPNYYHKDRIDAHQKKIIHTSTLHLTDGNDQISIILYLRIILNNNIFVS